MIAGPSMRAGIITCYPYWQVLCILKIFSRRLFESLKTWSYTAP